MARILANAFKSTKKVMKLRQAYNRLTDEINLLPEKYEKLERIELDRYKHRVNKKLERAAYIACDKEEYAEGEVQKRLKKYDVKSYMRHRAINHKAAKSIFKAVKAGKDYSAALKEMENKTAVMQKKRDALLIRLNKQKAAFLKKNNASDISRFEADKTVYLEKYEAFSNEVKKKYSAAYESEKAKLTAKAGKILAKIEKKKGKSVDKNISDDVILSVKGLKMYFGGLRAVDDLNFEVKKGEIFGLIGPNGAGKTTVFNCITQFYKPTAGELLFTTKDGETIKLTDYKVHDIVLKGIARTFQNVEVVKEVTVLDNLLIAATRNYSSSLLTQMLHLPKLSREEKLLRAKADKILKYMDLYAYRDRLAWGLPYGVLKRIEIARALMCNPQLIILDEPAAGLNESETRELAKTINKIRADFDCTILLVEHDMGLVMSICDHICAISFGKKLADGTPAEVQASKEVQEAYLGSGGD